MNSRLGILLERFSYTKDMKCPDCGSRLSESMVGGMLSFRCFKCGGFWVDSKVVNNVPQEYMRSLRRIKIDPMWLSGGKGMCPQDGIYLQNYIGDQIPGYLHVKRCVRCGKWWFAGDSMFEFKALQVGGQNLYFSQPQDISKYLGVLLPAFALLVLVGGLGVAVKMTSQRQIILVPAYTESRFLVEYLGDGVIKITDKSGNEPMFVNYRRWGSDEEFVEVRGGVIEGVVEGDTYEIKVETEIINFIAI